MLSTWVLRRAIQNLDVTTSTATAQPEEKSSVASETTELIAEVIVVPAEAQTPVRTRSSRRAVSTTATPQGANVAPEARTSNNDATPDAGTSNESRIDRSECDRLLEIAATSQRAYWNALRALEKVVGFEIDDPGDLENTTVDELLEQGLTSRKKSRRPGVAGSAPRENSKTSKVVAMLKRPEGTTIEEIMTAMQWQKHTTRALLSAGGALVKKHGLMITSQTVGDAKRYYVTN